MDTREVGISFIFCSPMGDEPLLDISIFCFLYPVFTVLVFSWTHSNAQSSVLSAELWLPVLAAWSPSCETSLVFEIHDELLDDLKSLVILVERIPPFSTP
jgi:hypothetical protein